MTPDQVPDPPISFTSLSRLLAEIGMCDLCGAVVWTGSRTFHRDWHKAFKV